MKKHIHLLSEGIVTPLHGPNWTIDSQVLEQLVSNFGTPIPVLKLAQSFDATLGWVVAVHRRGSELWGTVEIDEAAWQWVRGYHQISPCIQTEWSHDLGTDEHVGARLLSISPVNDGLPCAGFLHTAEDA